MIKEMQERLTEQVLTEAADLFGVTVETLKSLGGFESFVYEYDKGEKPYILKINHDVRRSFETLMGEVDWLHFLACDGAPVCRAVESEKGCLVGTIPVGGSNFYAISYEKAPGCSPEDTPESWTDELFMKLGETVGQMHRITKSYTPCHAVWKRQEWHEEEQLQARKYLQSADEELITFIESHINRLNALPKNVDTYGLVHSDISPRNFYTTSEKTIHLFDFDDIGYHYFADDIAIILYYALNYPPKEQKSRVEYAEQFVQNFLQGYSTQNGLDIYMMKRIPDFMRVRHALNYIIFHQTNHPDDLSDAGRAMLSAHRRDILHGTETEHIVRSVMERLE